MRLSIAVLAVLGVAGAGCGPQADSCGDDVAQLGEVCLREGPQLESEHAQELMDFDGDGVDDLVALHEDHVRFLHNRGDATFQPVDDIAYAELGGTPIVLHDIDGDGLDELGVFDEAVLQGPRDLSVFEREADGTPRLVSTLHLEWSAHVPRDLLGDFDGDGDRDVVFYGPDLAVLVHRIEGGFGEPIALEPFGITPAGYADVLSGDLDGDGADELCQAWPDGLRVRRGPELGESEMLAWSGAYAWAWLGELDGDLGAELVAYRADLASVRVVAEVFEHAGPAQPLARLGALESEGAWIQLADLNGDGLDDLLLPGERIDEAPRSTLAYYGEAGRVRLALGDGTFDDPIEVAGLNAADWRAAHLDDDDALDLARFSFNGRCGLPACSFYGAPLLSGR